jgi:hypothetical protein
MYVEKRHRFVLSKHAPIARRLILVEQRFIRGVKSYGKIKGTDQSRVMEKAKTMSLAWASSVIAFDFFS